MTFRLIVSQGRIADRTPGAIAGAALTAGALQEKTGIVPRFVGTPSAPTQDDWLESLPDARRTLENLGAAVSETMRRGNKTLLVANTCSASLATLPVVAREHPDAMILWIDAHGDFNTPESTRSGYLGGMVLAAGCGLWDSGHGAGIDPRQVVIVGARDIDTAEEVLLQQAGVCVLLPDQSTPEKILDVIGNKLVWVHIDWDVLEPGYVPAAYAIENGLLPSDLKAILAEIPRQQVIGIELAEFEVSGDGEKDAVSLNIIMDTVSPLFGTLPCDPA